MHTNDSEVSLKRYKYNGKERDEETGLDYYGARYYASWLCRFISVDPLKDQYPMQNPYTYADNNPITLIDFNGEGTGGDGEGGDDENIVTSTLRQAAKAVEFWSPSSAYNFGLTAGILEGVGGVLELSYRGSIFGMAYDMGHGNQTIQQEFIDGISALAEGLSTEEGREAIIEGIKKVVTESFKDATFQNGAFDAGLSHGEVVFGVLIGLATGGGGNAVKLLQAIKQGPKAVAAVLRNSLKSSIQRPEVNRRVDDATGGEFDGSSRMSEQVLEKKKGKYPTKYHKRSVEEVSILRKAFTKSGGARELFLKDLAATPGALEKYGQDAFNLMKNGKVPTNMNVHHKKPLFRGGSNNFDNLDLVDSDFHRLNNKALHWYPDGQNPYGLN